MEKRGVRVRTSGAVANRLREAWRAERTRLRRLLGEWCEDPGEPGLEPAEVRRRRAERRRVAGELKGDGVVLPSADALVTSVLAEELAERGWDVDQVPSVDARMVPVSRWPGTGTGHLGHGYPATVYARVPAAMVRCTVAHCWQHSAAAIAALQEWRDAHPDLTRRRHSPAAWAEYDQLAAQVLTPGDVYRAALARISETGGGSC